MTPADQSLKAAEICRLAPVVPVLVIDDLGHARKLAEALVSGVPDARLGERIHALIVARPGIATSGEVLRRWAAERMEKYKLPDVWHFGTDLPLGRTGKVDRGRLKELILAGTLSGLRANGECHGKKTGGSFDLS